MLVLLNEEEVLLGRAMATSSSSEQSASLEFTPTWIVAIVCTVIVAISMFMERFLHHLGKYLMRKKQNALFNSLEKLKEELMLLGFISLLLTVSQGPISGTCIPANAASHMLPCKKMENSTSQHYTFTQNRRRLLATGGESGHCAAQNKVPLLSVEALHQLHIFIFVLAVVHVLFCASTLILGVFKIEKKWKHWEKSIPKDGQSNVSECPSWHAIVQIQSHTHHHGQFLRERVMGSFRKSTIGSWIMAFFKQFHASVTKSDYICLRDGFVTKHSGSNLNFDFHKFMLRTLQRDFKQIVGITWYLWVFVVLFLLLDVDGWHTYFYLSFLPLILLLLVGTKLEHIITRLAQAAVADRRGKDVPRIKPSDEHFWFQRPRIVLYLLHFILFQNAFEFAFFFWILSTYGFDSCIMESLYYVIPRLIIGLAVQVLCSYSTLPLYAIVSQMGDEFKESMFEEEVHSQLHGWLQVAKKRTGSSQKGKAGPSNPEIQMHRMEHEVLHGDHHPISLEGSHNILI